MADLHSSAESARNQGQSKEPKTKKAVLVDLGT